MDPLVALRAWLAEAPLGPADRLPSERDLATRLGLSRASLRQALGVIEREGRLRRHVGRGTFLLRDAPRAELHPAGGATVDQPDDLAATASPREVLQARLVLEPELARLAAIHASARDIAALREAEAAVRGARSWQAYDSADGRFHRGIAAAAGNHVLLAVADRMAAVRRMVAFGQLVTRSPYPPPDHPSFAEHAAVTAAIADRDRDGAAAAFRHHLMAEAASLLGPFA